MSLNSRAATPYMTKAAAMAMYVYILVSYPFRCLFGNVLGTTSKRACDKGISPGVAGPRWTPSCARGDEFPRSRAQMLLRQWRELWRGVSGLTHRGPEEKNRRSNPQPDAEACRIGPGGGETPDRECTPPAPARLLKKACSPPPESLWPLSTTI